MDDHDEFRAMFRELAVGRLARVHEASSAVVDASGRARIEHEIHALKGEAIQVGLRDIAAVAQRLETRLAAGAGLDEVFDAGLALLGELCPLAELTADQRSRARAFADADS